MHLMSLCHALQENRVLKSRNHFRLPNCDALESYGNGSRKVCSHIGLTSIDHSQVTCEYWCVEVLKGVLVHVCVCICAYLPICDIWEFCPASISTFTFHSPTPD